MEKKALGRGLSALISRSRSGFMNSKSSSWWATILVMLGTSQVVYGSRSGVIGRTVAGPCGGALVDGALLCMPRS